MECHVQNIIWEVLAERHWSLLRQRLGICQQGVNNCSGHQFSVLLLFFFSLLFIITIITDIISIIVIDYYSIIIIDILYFVSIIKLFVLTHKIYFFLDFPPHQGGDGNWTGDNGLEEGELC